MVSFLLSLLVLSLLLPFPALCSEDEGSEDPDKSTKKSGLIIRDNEIEDNPIAIYVGHKYGKVFIENNALRENGEAIRWIMSQDAGSITGNRIQNNLVGLKIQDTYSPNDRGLIRFPDMAVEDIVIQNNRIYRNPDGNIVNTTGKQPILAGNFWNEERIKEEIEDEVKKKEKTEKPEETEKNKSGKEGEKAGAGGSAGEYKDKSTEVENEEFSDSSRGGRDRSVQEEGEVKEESVVEKGDDGEGKKSEKNNFFENVPGGRDILMAGGGVAGILAFLLLLS